ncbi:MAG: TonB-dependent receptor plug domain-containing protein, partial [Methylocystis sp.]
MTRRRLATTLSSVVVGVVLPASDAFAHTISLPKIDVGGQRRTVNVPHVHTPSGPRIVSSARRSSPVVAAVSRPPAEPSGPQPPPITASSEKFFTGAEVNALPFARSSEALEIVPGLIVTQHSGDGKANQYYLRGFNLDHGTDLALYLDGMPLNMRTHGHGQGYADANFLIPELLSYVLARKGPYDAQDGDFS